MTQLIEVCKCMMLNEFEILFYSVWLDKIHWDFRWLDNILNVCAFGLKQFLNEQQGNVLRSIEAAMLSVEPHFIWHFNMWIN